jgi:hypothetical protein
MENLYEVKRRNDLKDWQIVCYDGQPGGEVIATCKSRALAEKIRDLIQVSELPIAGSVIFDAEILGWAQARGMYLFYSAGSWHIKIARTWCTVGYNTPQEALEACWESGEYDNLAKCSRL